ncbi:MAG: hypothetical protein ACP5QP_08160 [Brevinematia bacterium]
MSQSLVNEGRFPLCCEPSCDYCEVELSQSLVNEGRFPLANTLHTRVVGEDRIVAIPR